MAASENNPEPGKFPRRLDAAAAEAAGVSRRRAQRLIADGRVKLNGRVAAAGDKGKPVDESDVVGVAADIGRVVPQPELSLAELAAGPGWVAVDKPAGTPVHPLRDGETGTVLNALAARCPQVQGVGESQNEGGLKSGVVHRLDVDTSGVLLVALDEERWQRFRAAFSAHRVEKRYVAVVRGGVERETGRADVWLAVTRHRPARVEVVPVSHPAARRCTLRWTVAERFADATRLDIQLETGFLHQIRATFAERGHPVWGDPVYGTDEDVETPAPRMLLHAASLKLDDINAVSPLPAAFEDQMDRLSK